MLTRTRKIYVGAVVIYLLVIVGQMAYAIYDNALISKNMHLLLSIYLIQCKLSA